MKKQESYYLAQIVSLRRLVLSSATVMRWGPWGVAIYPAQAFTMLAKQQMCYRVDPFSARLLRLHQLGYMLSKCCRSCKNCSLICSLVFWSSIRLVPRNRGDTERRSSSEVSWLVPSEILRGPQRGTLR